MGVVFLEAIGDPSKQYECRTCYAYLCSDMQLVSNQFQSSSGPALLFSKVVNITSGKPERKTMLTGPHIIRDVFCKSCKGKLGWMYEFAFHKREEYKEGKVILEVARIRKSG